ncbi:MAG TPA: amidohydrolase family protein [Thermoanaerobaculia bacterium]|jgi:imidazolonepropionase-like amidohydrolase|nr:amidohydrolase family protein [Thermoanaerobaculia bacterium]
MTTPDILRRISRLVMAIALLTLLARTGYAAETDTSRANVGDIAAARAVFERNLQAIRARDKTAYLACYLDSEALARTGFEGPQLGYKGLAASVGQGWPDHIDADDIHLTSVRPGLVYGTYRYRVRYGGREDTGISERLFVQTPQGWKIAVTTAFTAQPGVPPPPRALVGATLVDGTGAAPVPDAVVVLRDGKIDCAGSRAACPVPAGVDVSDVKGLWITPGLVDAHVHFSQTGWADGRPDSMDVRAQHPYKEVISGLARHPERFGRTYLCTGVTAVFDVGGYVWTLGLPAWSEASTEVPHVAAAGPLLSTVDHWLNLPAERQFVALTDEAAARAGVRYLAERGAAAVKIWYIVDEKHSVEQSAAAVHAAGEEARAHKLPLIVHATGLAEAKEALRAGAKLLVHSVADEPVDDEFLALAKKNGAIYCPTLTVFRGYFRMTAGATEQQPPKVDDPNGCVDPQTLARVAETAKLPSTTTPEALKARDGRLSKTELRIGANLKRVFDAGIPIAMGTDAGNPLTLHGPSVYAEMEAMQAAGLTPMQVLTASTRGGALAMGREKDFGTVEKGKQADLLIVGADPTQNVANLRQVRWVVRGGAVRSIQELHALATTAAEKSGE